MFVCARDRGARAFVCVCVLFVIRIKKIEPLSLYYLSEQQEAARFISSLQL